MKNEKIGYYGWLSMVMMATMGKVFNPSPIIISEGDGGRWLVILCLGLLGYLSLYLIIRYMRSSPNQGLIHVIAGKSGYSMATIYATAVFVTMVFNGAISLRLLVDQTKIVTLPDTPIAVLMTTGLSISFYLAWKGIHGLSRVAHILLPWMFIIIISLVFFLINRLDITYFFPVFGSGPIEIIGGGIRNILYFGEVLALPLLGHLVVNQANFEKGLLRGYLFSVLLSSCFALLELLVFSWPILKELSFPFLEMARLVYLTRFIQHLEGFFSAVWLLIALTQIGIHLYLTTFAFSCIFRIKNFRPLHVPVASLFYMLALSPTYFYETLIWKKVLIEIGGAFGYAILLAIFISSYVRRRKEQKGETME